MPRRCIFLLFALIAFSFMVSAQEATQAPRPTPTPTVTPMANLPHYPTNDELYSYALYHEGLLGDPSWISYAELIFRDFNGDSEDDLLIHGFFQIAVMVWHEGQYSKPFLTNYRNYLSGRNPQDRILFEDWTNDDIPEIIFDAQLPYTGTFVGGGQWIRRVIHCGEIACQLAWEAQLQKYYHEGYRDGVSLSQTEIEQFINDSDLASLRTRRTGFYMAYAGYLSVGYVENYYHVGDVVQSTYVWDGSIFTATDSVVLEQGYDIEPNPQLLASNSKGIKAQIKSTEYEMYNDPPEYDTACQVIIGNTTLDGIFGCIPDYTQIMWQDIVADEQEELVIMTIAGKRQAYSEVDCFHQRVVVYQSVGNEYHQIANILGCITQPDSFGVKIKDINGDGQVEIVSSGELYVYTADSDTRVREGCWYELNDQNNIYEWNGESFEYAYSVPREKE